LYKYAPSYVKIRFMDVPMVAEPGLIPDMMGLAVNKVFTIRTFGHDEENISEIKVLQ